jgi:subtilisin family serine protease
MKKLLLLILASAVIFLGFQAQDNQRYYYAFNEKILLTEVEQKLVVRYSEVPDKNIEGNSFRKSDPTATQKWHDDKTVVLSSSSKIKRDELAEELKKSPKVVSCQPMYKINTGLEMVLTDEVLVRFKPNTQKNKQGELLQRNGATVVKSTPTYQLIKVPKGADALDIANQYQESGLVEFSHPNFIVEIEKHQQVIPNDPYFANQFTLNNTGQIFNDGHFGAADADIDAPEAWALTAGGNVLVAVLDEGVSPNHPDLPNARQVRLNGSNFGDGDPNDPSPTGNMNHGNSCAGVIAATQNNNEGIAGLCTNCRIMPIRIFNANGTGIPSNRLVDAIDFARMNGAAIISNSWGFNSDDPNLIPAIVSSIQTATTQGRGNLGCVVLFSAGNNAVNNGFVHFPSNVNIPGVLTVGASDRDDLKSFYSPLGNINSPRNQVLDISAPSHRAYPFQINGETFEAWSIDIPANAGYNPWPQFTAGTTESVVPPAIGEQLPNAGVNFQSYTGRFGGTSHSCPVVAGVAALMLSANPSLTQQQVFDILTNTADRVGGYNYVNNRSNELGFGRVNACSAVIEAFRTGNSINGLNYFCSSSTFALQNSPNPNRITWTSTIPTGLAVSSTGVATRQNNFSGLVGVVGTVSAACGNFFIQRDVWVGNPPADNNTLIWTGVRGTNPVTLNAGSTNQYQCDFVPYADSYTWVLPRGFTAIGSTTTPSPFISINTSNQVGTFTLFCRANNGACVSWTRSLTINVVSSGGGGQQMRVAFPNPTNSSFSIKLKEEDSREQTEVSLFNKNMERVYFIRTEEKDISISTTNILPGLYYLTIAIGKDITQQQIVINH